MTITREYAGKYDDREEVMDVAIEYCIGHGILQNVLRIDFALIWIIKRDF